MLPIAHSHTSLKQYEQCPHRYYRQRILKDVKDVMSPAAAAGDAVHKALELRVRDGVPLPPQHAQYEKIAKTIEEVSGDVYCEAQLGCRADLEPCEFFADGVWLRGKIDVLAIDGDNAVIIDYKTGKYRGDDGQAGRNAILTFAAFPGVRMISSRFLYLQTGKIDPKTFHRVELPDLLEPSKATAGSIEWSVANNAWPKRPTPLCGWCPVRDCSHWKPPRT